MPTITKNKIIYDSTDWLAGIDKIQSSAANNAKLGNGLTSNTNQVDPLRKIGYLSIGYNPTDVTNISSVTGIIKNAVIKGDSAYMIASDKVHRLDTLAAGTINTTSPFPHTIDHGHTNEEGSDIVNYYVGTSLKAFYSFHDDTDWDVGTYDYTSNTFDDDYMSTVPASAMTGTDLTDGKDIPHPLIIGDDDILYMGSGRYIHAFDGQTGANGTFSSKVLTLPQGYTVTCFARLDNQTLAIGAYYTTAQGTTFNKGEVRVFTWKYTELDPYSVYDLNDNYISEMFNWNGTIACFTDGRKSQTKEGSKKLQVFDGTRFKPIVEWNTGNLPIRGGVDVVGDDIYWNSSGIIYSYTRIPNSSDFAFNHLDGTGTNSSGMLKVFTQLKTIHFSEGSGIGKGLRNYGSGYGEAGSAYGKYTYLDMPNDKKARLTSISITFQAPVSGGRSLYFNSNFDNATPQFIADFTEVTDLKVKYEQRADGSKFGDFTRIQPIIGWNSGSGSSTAPTVEKIEYEYELVNV